MASSTTVGRARSGDREAFGALVTEYRSEVFGLCFGMTGSTHDAEDLTHDAFVTAFLKLSQLRDADRFGPWLRALALNLCRGWHRARRRDQDGLLAAPVPAAAEGDGLEGLMTGGVSRLGPSHRLALVLHYWEGLSYKEMATYLGVPLGTVMSRLHRARSALRTAMEEMMESGEVPTGPEQDLRGEVDAEIGVLLKLSGRDNKRMERLTVLLARSPERYGRLVREAAGEAEIQNLALVLRHWESFAMGITSSAMSALLDGCFSEDEVYRARSRDVVSRWVARCRPGPLRDTHLFLDMLVAYPVDAQSRVALLLDLIEVGESADTVTLFTNVMLCYPDAAFALLMERFWEMDDVEELHDSSRVLCALARTGVRFCEALLGPLAGGDRRRLALALAGMEAIGRAVDPGWQGEWDLDRRIFELWRGGRFSPLWGARLRPGILADLTLTKAAALVAEHADHPCSELRVAAIRALGRLRARGHSDQLSKCLVHEHASTRIEAIRALAEIGEACCPDALVEATRVPSSQERRVAAEAIGRLRVTGGRQRCMELIDDPDAGVRQAAVIALGELGGEKAEAALKELIRSGDKKLVRSAGSALYGGRQQGRPQSETTKERLRRVRGEDARPFLHISPLAAIWALPEIRPYGERELTRRIAEVCGDYSTTRRHLVMEGKNSLMVREAGVYTFTDLGEAVWRVERYIRDRYLKQPDE